MNSLEFPPISIKEYASLRTGTQHTYSIKEEKKKTFSTFLERYIYDKGKGEKVITIMVSRVEKH